MRAAGRTGRTGRLVALMTGVVLVVPTVASAAPGRGGPSGPPPGPPPAAASDLAIEVLSSPPEYVSGGDARLRITVPRGVDPASVQVLVDGDDVSEDFTPGDSGALQGLVDGLPEGDTEVVARATRGRAGRPGAGGHLETRVVLTNHDLTGPMFSGPQQEPFGCSTPSHLNATRASDGAGPGLATPSPDNDCMTEPVVSHVYRAVDGPREQWLHYDPADPPALEDVAMTTTLDGEEIPLIVRWERGTINRFVYSIAVPVPPPSAGAEDEPADLDSWNERLVYHFQGGVGIGHYQGSPDRRRMLFDIGLEDGSAVIYSTGTKTGEHYNLQVGGETAIMVKDRFVSAYDAPRYTVGIGASGGAIQQYVYGQNHPGLIDAAIPVQSYPDMVTQTIHVGDCELLERWMDMRVASGADDAAQWGQWSNRTALLGLNAVDTGVTNVFAPLMPWMPAEGSTECRNAWRGLSALALNPHFGEAPGVDQTAVEWTHFADAVNVYGVNPDDGFANRTWDNVGVQYGLQALRDGVITPEQFLDLNWNVGSWKDEPDMVQESCPYIGTACAPQDFDPWSQRNMNLASEDAPAPRVEADPGAIEAAYTSGLVFHGDIEIPVIDWRPYLEPWLDMHNAHQSFAARQRLLDHDGDASNQVIWFTAGDQPRQAPQVEEAFEVMDEWMANIAAHPNRPVHANAPAGAVDACFAEDGTRMAEGDHVWSGILDGSPVGPCTEAFPLYSQSRIVAGGPITGDVFKCGLMGVQDAVAAGVYGDWTPTADQRATLEQIFPDGVCDWSQGDVRRPQLD